MKRIQNNIIEVRLPGYARLEKFQWTLKLQTIYLIHHVFLKLHDNIYIILLPVSICQPRKW